MLRRLLIGAAALLPASTAPLPAAAAPGRNGDARPSQVPPGYLLAGTLDCAIAGGVNPLVGADRDLACIFRRPRAVSERYEGLTGIVTARSQAPQRVGFAVWMPKPDALAALAGDYNGARIAPVRDSSLVGGRDDGVVLTPLESGAATDLEALNALLRLNQLHLNYGGRVPRDEVAVP